MFTMIATIPWLDANMAITSRQHNFYLWGRKAVPHQVFVMRVMVILRCNLFYYHQQQETFL